MRAPDPPRPRTPKPGALWGLLLFPKPPASLRAPERSRPVWAWGISTLPPRNPARGLRRSCPSLGLSRVLPLGRRLSASLGLAVSFRRCVSDLCPPSCPQLRGRRRSSLAGGCLPRPVPARRSDGGARLRPEAPSPTESGFRSVGCLGSIPATSVPRVTRELAAGSELGGSLPGFSHPPSRAAHSAHTLARTCRSPSPSPPSTRGRGAGTRCCGGRCCWRITRL